MLTGDQARQLAALGRERRGWNEPGSMSALRKVADLDADEIAAAWARFLDDSSVRTPGAFPNLAGPHWVAPPAPKVATRPVPIGALCDTCGQAEHVCRRVPAAISGHEYESKAAYDARLERDRAQRAGVDPDTGEILTPEGIPA